jgi:CDP-Glycerol:Poly(glycerophosphate) glycerophosphotransferase
MIKVLFDLKKEYYFNSLFPVYDALKEDPDYDIYFNVGKDQKRFLGIFLIEQKNKIEDRLAEKGLKFTDDVSGFDAVICGDALKNPERYGKTIRIHLDHGVGIKTLRIRNIYRQKDYHYHVFLEGQYWLDYIKSVNMDDRSSFYVTGIPKLDPFFWQGYYNKEKVLKQTGLNPARRTVLFAPSYKPSCIKYVQEKITDLLEKYNLLIKLHPYSWAGKYAPHAQHRFYEKLADKYNDVCLIDKDDFDIYPYLFLADTIISDTSSVVNEFLALGRHGVIYVLPEKNILHSDGMPVLSVEPDEWLKGAFTHAHSPDEILPAVDLALNPTAEMKEKLKEYRYYFFTGLDGNSGKRVKKEIDKLVL